MNNRVFLLCFLTTYLQVCCSCPTQRGEILRNDKNEEGIDDKRSKNNKGHKMENEKWNDTEPVLSGISRAGTRTVCAGAYPMERRSLQKNALRISKSSKKCGNYFRTDNSTIETDAQVIVEIQNDSSEPMTIGRSCDPVSYLSAIIVENVNDRWDIGTGGGVLLVGCELPPKHAVQFSLNIQDGGNISHPVAKAAIKSITPGCYTARLATSGRLLPFKFKLCITEKKS